MATWRDVRRIALALPGTSESTSRETPAWTVDGNFFVWDRPLRKADIAALGARAPKGPILGVRTADLEMKEAVLAGSPRIFFTTPHFDGYPAVLVQLDKISVSALEAVILDAWLARAKKKTASAYLESTGPDADRKRTPARRSKR